MPALAVIERLAGTGDDGSKRKWPRKGLVFSITEKRPINGFSRAEARLDADMLALAQEDAEAAGEDRRR